MSIKTNEIYSACCKFCTTNKCSCSIPPEKHNAQQGMLENFRVPGTNTSSTSDQTSSAARSESNTTDDERETRILCGKHLRQKSVIPAGGGMIKSWSIASDNHNKLKSLEQSIDTEEKSQHRMDVMDKLRGHPKRTRPNPQVQHFSKELLDRLTQHGPPKREGLNPQVKHFSKELLDRLTQQLSECSTSAVFQKQALETRVTADKRRLMNLYHKKSCNKHSRNEGPIPLKNNFLLGDGTISKRKKISELLPECRIPNIEASGARRDFSKWFQVLPHNIHVDKDIQTDRGIFTKDNFPNDQALERYLNIH